LFVSALPFLYCSVHARAAVAVAAVSGDDASIASESVTVLSATPSPAQGVGSHLVLKVPASIDPKAVRASLMASEGVEAVVQNRVVRIAQAHGTASEWGWNASWVCFDAV
jgi:hypothetical protein